MECLRLSAEHARRERDRLDASRRVSMRSDNATDDELAELLGVASESILREQEARRQLEQHLARHRPNKWNPDL